MNDYFTSPADLAALTKARSVDFNTLDSSIDAAFDKLPTREALLTGTQNYAVDTGTPNAIVIALPAAIVALADGMQFRVKLKNTITGAATATLGVFGTFPVRRPDLTAIQSELVANQVANLTYVGGVLHASSVMLPTAGSGLPITGGTMTGGINEALAQGIPAAATLDLQNIGGNFVHITGAGASIGAILLGVGAHRTVVFDGVNTLLHSAALLLPGLANINTASGDRMSVRGDANGTIVVAYQRADGTPVVQPLLPGDLLYSARALTAPAYLKADGATYSKIAYPALSAALGSIPNSFNTWLVRSNGGTPSSALSGVVNGPLLVIGCNNGLFYSSPDGITWTSKGSIGSNVYGLAYGAGLYVATTTTGRIFTSTDLMTWTQRVTSATTELLGITFANGGFVVVGRGAAIITSPDGITWTGRATAITGFDGYGITYAAGLFVAVGNPTTVGVAAIQTSPDGVTWTSRVNGTDTTLYAVGFGNGLFVACGGNVQSATGTVMTILTSPDGITWTARTAPTTSQDGNAVAWNGTHFVMGIKSGNATYYSADGITWTANGTVIGTTSRFLVMGTMTYAMCSVNTNAIVRRMVSATFNNVAAWTPVQVSLVTNGVTNSSIANNVFMLGVSAASTVLLTSTDGLQWSNRTIPSGGYGRDAAFGAGVYVVVGASGIISSPDGITWTSRLAIDLNNVTFANSLFVATGNTGKLYTSPDGINWTIRTAGGTSNLHKTAYANGRWVCVSKVNGYITSTDGITWPATLTVPRTGFKASGIAYGNGLFVMVGEDLAGWFALTSPDAQTWAESLISNTVASGEVTFGSGIFYAISAESGFIASSFDGKTWVLRSGALAVANTVAIGPTQVVCGATASLTLANSLFSYDTATTFCVPALPSRSAVTPYYKA